MTRFLQDDRISFVAGRHFRTGGRPYIPGEEVPDARNWKNLESCVRSRYLIPVSDDVSELHPRFQRDVKNKEFMLDRLKFDPEKTWVEPEPEPEVLEYNPDMKIDDLLGYLDEHPQDVENVLAMEREHKNRPRLISKLEERLTAPEEETIDV